MTTPAGTIDIRLTCAIGLGWRIASLYALADDFDPPLADTMLPLHDSLEHEDQLELQVRTAAGDARRIGITETADALEALVPDARAAVRSDACCAAFRSALRSCHVEIDMALWACSESGAKAYELGNGLSDTYNRICRAYRDQNIDVADEWQKVFDGERIQRLKNLLQDLQSRLDRRAVTVVTEHLEAWHTRVSVCEDFTTPTLASVRRLLRRQTIMWRQLLAGDKEPEAFLDRKQRAALGSELAKLVWKRYLPCVPALAAIVAVFLLAVGHLHELSHWYSQNLAATGVATLLASVAGALGITQASVGLTVRTRMREWTELLWNRSVAKMVADVTLIVDELLPVSTRPRVVTVAVHASHRVGDRIRPDRPRNATQPVADRESAGEARVTLGVS
jgi:hypothetical protein